MNIGIVCDFVEERWFSMDLAAELLYESIGLVSGLVPKWIQPSMPRRFSTVPLLGKTRFARNADRMAGRRIEYPKHLKQHSGLDLYHIVDHSYANLVHALPPERVVVTCHDVDAFEC